MKNLKPSLLVLWMSPFLAFGGGDIKSVQAPMTGASCSKEAAFKRKDPALYALMAFQCGWKIESSHAKAQSFYNQWGHVFKNTFSSVILNKKDAAESKEAVNDFVKMMKAEFDFNEIPDSVGPEVNTSNALEEILGLQKKKLPHESLIKFALDVSAKITSEGHLDSIQGSLIEVFNTHPESFIQMLLRVSVTQEEGRNWCQRLVSDSYMDKFIPLLESAGGEGGAVIKVTSLTRAQSEILRLRNENASKGKEASPCLTGQLDTFEKALVNAAPSLRESPNKKKHANGE